MNVIEKNNQIILEGISENFEPKHIFECGQCFRWNEQDDGSYTGVIKNAIINVKKEDENIIFTGKCDTDIQQLI